MDVGAAKVFLQRLVWRDRPNVAHDRATLKYQASAGAVERPRKFKEMDHNASRSTETLDAPHSLRTPC